MSLGLSLSLGLGLGASGGGASFTPAAIPGLQFWPDPSDLATLFQDAAGTVPVTGVGQPVGFVGDKSQGFALGPELVVNGDFSNGATGWNTQTGWAIAGGVAVAATAGSAGVIAATPPVTSGVWYQVTFRVVSISGGTFRPVLGTQAGVSRTTSGVFTEFLLANGTSFQIQTVGATTGTVDNISVRELPGNHATQPTAACRPMLRQTAGGLYYLEFDGIDDFLVTGNINFSNSDEITVCAGVRKLSDAAVGVVVELGTSGGGGAGEFGLYAALPSNGYTYRPKGLATPGASTPAAYASPVTTVLSGMSDISDDVAIIRANGAVAGTSPSDQGTGNYTNAPLFIGRRGGTSLPFNGHLYALPIYDRLLPADQLAQLETYVAAQTGVTL